MSQQLPSHSELGGYEINYIMDGHALICNECANKQDDETKKELEQFIHWEGDAHYCEECGEKIESIYGEIEE